jgi:hypothetical protein
MLYSVPAAGTVARSSEDGPQFQDHLAVLTPSTHPGNRSRPDGRYPHRSRRSAPRSHRSQHLQTGSIPATSTVLCLRSRRSGDIKAAIPLATGGGLRVCGRDLDAVAASAPLVIREIQYNDPVRVLFGPDWSLTLACPWHIEDTLGAAVLDWEAGTVKDAASDLIGSSDRPSRRSQAALSRR